jgi:hypothetical protein
MKKVVLLFVLVVAVLVPATIHSQGLVEYYTSCSDPAFDFVEGFFPPGQIPEPPGGEYHEAYWVTGGPYIGIIVDNGDCYIAANATVYGSVIEPSDTDWSIYVDPASKVYGDIEEKGDGDVRMTVGGEQLYQGKVKEEGPGNVWLWIDGMFSGRVEEMNDGWLRIDVFGDYPSAGPGTFNGKVVEEGSGDATLVIEAPGGYNGIFKEEGPGDCYVQSEWRDQQPRGRIMCDPVIWLPWPPPE